MVKNINKSEFESEVLRDNGVVVVDFFANWCNPCKMIAPILDEVQNEMSNIKIVKVDIDENPSIAADYKVKNIPTIKFFKNGEEVDSKVGFTDKESLKQIINKIV